MPFVSITRLRVRSWRYVPGFLVDALRSAWQAKTTPANLAVSLLSDRSRVYWTRTVWSDEAAMRSFMVSGAVGVAPMVSVKAASDTSPVCETNTPPVMPPLIPAFVAASVLTAVLIRAPEVPRVRRSRRAAPVRHVRRAVGVAARLPFAPVVVGAALDLIGGRRCPQQEASWCALERAFRYCRTERKPFMIEALVSRLYGHSSSSGAPRSHDPDCIADCDHTRIGAQRADDAGK